MNILAIETSCDETAVAIVRDGRTIRSHLVASQVEIHREFGGVVPEIASRCHVERISELTHHALEQASMALEEIDGIGVTYAPGLIGALLVGIHYAKGLAFSLRKPLIPVHHIQGHVAANYLAYPDLQPPFLCLVASGGHSHILRVSSYTDYQTLGRTRDDAAGEAYDKVARVLGFPYPGGASIDKAAQTGDPNRYPLPAPRVEGSPNDLSFSGLKTAVIHLVHRLKQSGEPYRTEDIAAAFQQQVIEALTSRLFRISCEHGDKIIVLAGGVAANSGLRQAVTDGCKANGLACYIPPLSLCGDNAAMIASQAFYEWKAGHIAGLDLNGVASMPL